VQCLNSVSISACSQPHGWIEPASAARSCTHDCQPHEIRLSRTTWRSII